MKKFLTAILVLIFAATGYAQCIQVEITPIKGQCINDNHLKVVAREMPNYPEAICGKTKHRYLIEIQGPGKGGDIYPMVGYPAEYTFYNLEAAQNGEKVKYKIIVRDQDTGAYTEEEATVESNYVPMKIQNLQAIQPVSLCGGGVRDGGVRFQLIGGGVGPFEVTLYKMDGTLLAATQTFARPAHPYSDYIEFRDNAVQPNSQIIVQIKDKTNIGDQCGETRRWPSFQIPAARYRYTVDCINIKMYKREMYKSANNCSNYNMSFYLVRNDSNYLYSGLDNYCTELNDWFKQPGTAMVYFKNSSKAPIDISSTFNCSASYYSAAYVVPNYPFAKGDEIELVIKGPKNTIRERYRFDQQLDMPTGGCNTYIRGYNNSWGGRTYWRELTCGTQTQVVEPGYLSAYYSNYNTDRTANFPDVNTGEARYVSVYGFLNGYTNLTLQRKVGSSWVDEVGNNPTVDGATYRYVYKNKPSVGCQDIYSCDFIVSKPPHTTTGPLTIQNRPINKIWDDVRIGYGAYAGTGAFYISYSSSNFFTPLKFKVEPADGTKTVTYQGFIGIGKTVTRTITFPLESTSSGYTNLPTGNYLITVTDACGNTTTKQIFLPETTYNPSLSFTRDCEIAKISYNIGRNVFNKPSNQLEYVYLQKEVEDQYGRKTWQDVKMANGYNYIRAHSGEFPNLLPGKYRIFTDLITSYRGYAYIKYNATDYTYYSLTDPTTPYLYYDYDNYAKEITIPDLKLINPTVNPVICDRGSNTGVIAVDVTGEEVFFPLTFKLYKKATATATTSTKIDEVTYAGTTPANTKYFHLFRGLTTGYYEIETIHRCRNVTKGVDINVEKAFEPYLVIDRPIPFCRGDQARVKLGLSEHIFDVSWFKLDANGQPTTTAPIKTGSSFWEAIHTTTTYLAKYTIKPGIGCNNTTVYSQTATVVMPPADEPPFIKTPCPNDITVVVDVGQCSKMVRWREPEAFPSCKGAVTVTKTHNPGDMFPIGIHQVVYNFSDPNGNTRSCSFTVTVKSNAIKLNMSHRYTDHLGNTITQAGVNEQFYYELSYENVGSENISSATITLDLPKNSVLKINTSNTDLTQTGDGSWQNPYPIANYNSTTKQYQFLIGAMNYGKPYNSTLKLGDPKRVIRIPMIIEGNCTDILQACANFLKTDVSIAFAGGPSSCPLSLQVVTGTTSMTVDTTHCNREEIFCGTDAVTFEAIGSFNTYQWFKDGVLLPGETNRTYTALAAGVYKVEKTTLCQGTTVKTVETINYQPMAPTADPIRAQAQNVGVTCPDNNTWTSHFYLCGENEKTIAVDFRNTPFEWQMWNGGCTDSNECRNTGDNCWSTLHSNHNLLVSNPGKYRLKLTSTGCNQSFYFEVFKGSLSGTLTDIQPESNFQRGSVRLRLSANGVSYNLKIYKDGNLLRTEIINTNNYVVDNLDAGDYRIEAFSPQINGCTFEGEVTITKVVDMTATAVFQGFKDCNTAKLHLRAQGGSPTYRYYIWTIDGEKQYTDEQTALAATNYKAIQLSSQPTGVAVEIPNITRIGEYVFLVGDSRTGAFALTNKITIAPPSPHNFTVSATQEIQCEGNPNTGHINMIFAPGSQNQNRTIKLYTLDENGARLASPRSSAGGLFTNLPAGTYEIEMQSNIAGNVCTFTKKPIVILPTQAPLRAYAGVVADRSCDTARNQYKVSVNNVSGGTPPYRYSFDGEATYVATNIGFVAGNTVVYVKDSKDCRVSIPIETEATPIPNITLSPVNYRCDNGYGLVTITVSATASQTYEYTIDDSNKQPLTGGAIQRLLSPGVHTLTVYYRPANAATTPNVLFTEDFGTATATECLPSANSGDMFCSPNNSVGDGQHILTKQVATKTGWQPTMPTDATGGRYMAVAGNGGNEVIYKKLLTGVLSKTAMEVSFDAASFFPAGSTAVPARLRVDLCKEDGTVLNSSVVGAVANGATWTNFKASFAENQVTGFADDKLLVRIVNIAATTYNNMGNDFGLDNLRIQQATQYCDLKLTQLINIEKDKQMRVEKYGAEKNVSCVDSQDGAVRVRVINPASTRVIYSTGTTYTTVISWSAPVTLDAQGVFTVTGLAPTQNGELQVQDADNANCIVSLNYKIEAPAPIVPTVVLMERVTCYSGGTAKVKVSATGGTSGYRYQYGLVSATTLSTPTALNVNPVELSGIAPGTYSLVVTDANGCQATTTFSIADKATLTATAEPSSYCYSTSDEKKVKINIQSGNGNYRVQRIGGNSYTFNASSFEYPDALQVGTHTFVITDGFGCVETVTARIYEPLSLQVSPTTQQYANCKGQPITYMLTAEGGIPTMAKEFSYALNGDTTFQVIGTANSQIPFTITTDTTTGIRFRVSYKPDGSTCSRDRYITLLSDAPRFLQATFSTTEATCGLNNGTVHITPADYYVGTVSHTLQVRNAMNVPQTTLTALAPGAYTAYLTDDRGCSVSKTFTITAVPLLTATASVTKQIGCTAAAADLAAITVYLGAGGKAPFKVDLINTLTTQSATQNLSTNNISGAFTGLDYGTYQITITDANGCKTQLAQVINPNANVISITMPQPTSCAPTSSAIITSISSGAVSLTTNDYFAVYRPGIQNPTAGSLAQVTTANPNGGTDIWYKGTLTATGVQAIVPNLKPGVQYSFIVFNATTGCRFIQQAPTKVPTASTLTATLQVNNVSCADSNNDGTVSYTLASPNGLTTAMNYQVFRADSHQQITGAVIPAPFTTPGLISGLAAGKYYVTFTELIGGVASCVTSADFEIKRSATPLQVSLTPSQKATCSTNGQAWLNISGGTATYTFGYVVSGTAIAAAQISATTEASQYISLPAGNWDVYVRDNFGCVKSATVAIDLFDAPNLVSATTLACQAYNNTNGEIPVRITLNKIGQGNHYYTLDGGADTAVNWTVANQSFEIEVTPLVTHTVTVKDLNGCVSTLTFSTTALITATATLTKLKSCATPTAEMTVQVSGGTGVYSYTLERLDNGAVASATLAQGAAITTPASQVIVLGTPTLTLAATYRISIYDAETKDCPIVREVTVQDPDPISLNGAVIQGYNEKCNLGLTATGTGQIDVAMPIDADTYTFRIVSAIDVTTGNNLIVTTTPSSAGTHTATFSQLHGTVQGVKYEIQITNSTGCTVSMYAVLTSPEPITFETGVLTATTYACEGGAALAKPKVILDKSKIKGGVPPYTTEFIDGGGNRLGNGTQYTLTDLQGGTYFVEVKDASGACATTTASVTIAPAFELTTLSITTVTSATCAVDEVIKIEVGTSPAYLPGTVLRYVVQGVGNGIATVTTLSATSLTLPLVGSKDLKGSNYTIEVINQQTGCSLTGVHSIKDVNTFAIEAHNPVRAICYNDLGSINLTLSDLDLSNGDQAAAGFTYTVTAVGGTTATSSTVAGSTATLTLKGGSYDVEAVSNATGCQIAKYRFVIPSNPAEIAVINVSQKVSVDCNNQNGVAALTITGGQQTYTVKLTGPTTKVVENVLEGAPGIEVAGLDAGIYNITLEDALGCTTATGTLNVVIAPYNSVNVASVTVETVSITCIDAKDGKLKVQNVTGGAKPYHYILVRTSPIGSQLPEIVSDDSAVTFEGIEPGTYRVDISDAKNCLVTLPGSYVFANPQPISVSIDEVNSKFYTCNGAENGKITLSNLTGGTGTYTIDIVRADNGQRVVTTHRGINTTTDEFTNIPATPLNTHYEVRITDSNGCVMTKTVSFTVVEFPDIAINRIEQKGTCEAQTNNFKDYLEVEFRNPDIDFSKLHYRLNGTATTTTFVRTAGKIGYIDEFDRTTVTQTLVVYYTVTSTLPGHSGTCETTESTLIELYTPLVLTQVSNTNINTVEVIARGGKVNTLRGYSYYFNGVAQADNPVYKISYKDPERIDNGVRIKIIDVVVEDAEGCTTSLTVEMPYYEIEVPNFFTPDGDGENDVWRPKNLDNNVNARIYVFDRYGRRLANLNPGDAWDGTYDGKTMPAGDYWYIIEINDELYDKRQFYGNFTLYR